MDTHQIDHQRNESDDMSNDNTAKRAALLRAAKLVKPALAERAFLPVLQHISFNGEWATAFNDKMAIAVRCDSPVQRLIPGQLLVDALQSFGGNEVLFQQDTDDAFVLRSGRSRVKLPTLPLKDFPFDWPAAAASDWIDMNDEMVTAIKRCLISVNKDASQPAQVGVTMDMDEERHAVFFSTDNGSISRCECKSRIELPGDAPIIMPLPFCEQFIALMEAYGEKYPPCMAVGDGWLEVQFAADAGAHGAEARLFTTMPVDLDPMDFPKIMRKHCGDVSTLHKRLTLIPDAFDPALARALLVLGNEVRKKVTCAVEDRVMQMHASSDMGDSDDELKLDINDVGPVPMDGGLVMRALKHAKRIGINDTVTILVGGERMEFVHIVAHVRDLK